MSNYVKATNFTAKDALPTGDSGKIVKGTEIDVEFTAIASAISSKADSNSPTFTGTPLAPTASAATNNTQIATTAYADAAVLAERTATATLTNKSLTSPTLTGVPTSPTAASGTNTTQIATTAFVNTAITGERTVAATLTSKTLTSPAINSPTISGGTITGITDLAIADGGTGASSATDARNNLGLGSLAVLSAVGTSQITDGSVTPAKLSQKLTSGAVQSASGTSVNYTSIPSWVQKITIAFNGVSTNGSSIPLIQIGDSGGIETSGYTSIGLTMDVLNTQQTTGFGLSGTWNSTETITGVATLVLLSGSTWIFSSNCAVTNNNFRLGAGTKTLSGTLDRLRLTTVNGTDSFDLGSINIMYE